MTEHSPADFANPITGLTREETDKRFRPLYDAFVKDIDDKLKSEQFKDLNIAEGMDTPSGEALLKLLKDEIPQCCSGHTFESLMEIVNMFALTNMVCKSSDCPETLNHEFLDVMVARFQTLGEDMEKVLTS